MTITCGHVEGPGHDCTYVEWRNQLSLTAEELADSAFPEPLEAGRDEHRAWRRLWDLAFHQAMTDLVARNKRLMSCC